MTGTPEPTPRMWKADLPHYPNHGPGACMCADCRVKVRMLRCPVKSGRSQCGDYRGHRGEHIRLVATCFLP